MAEGIGHLEDHVAVATPRPRGQCRRNVQHPDPKRLDLSGHLHPVGIDQGPHEGIVDGGSAPLDAVAEVEVGEETPEPEVRRRRDRDQVADMDRAGPSLRGFGR